MANADTAYGFRPVNKDGSPWSGSLQKAYYAGDTSTTLYPGDPVALSGTGDSNGVPGVQRATVTGPVWGVVSEVAGDSNGDLLRDTSRYLSTAAGYVNVVRAQPGQYFVAQEDSAGQNLAAVDIGQFAAFVFGSPSTSHPIISAAEIDSSSVDGTTVGAMRIIGLKQSVDNAIGTNAEWIVEFVDPTPAEA